MRNRNQVGLSLVEALIALSLFATIAAILANVFGSAMRSYGQTSERVHLMQLATVALEKLRADLSQTSVEGVTILDPSAVRQLVVVHKIEDVDSSGTPALSDRLIIYQWAGERLSQSYYDPPVVGTISATYQSPGLAQVETYLSSARTKVLASQVTHFRLEDANPLIPTLQLPLTVTIRVTQKVTRGRTAKTLELQRKIFLRNG